MMEKTPKSKLVGSKSKYRDQEKHFKLFTNNSDNGGLSKREVNDLETLPISPDVLKTPPVRTTSNLRNSVCHLLVNQSSPQFRVGWNDGSERNDCEMISPVSAPIQRKIRRCPESLLCKVSSTAPSVSEKKIENESDCDIMQCIKWARNLLIESAIIEKENTPSNDTDVMYAREDVNADILDDSTNELMILCSQAVEESLPRLNVSPVPSKIKTKKHFITPENDDRRIKRIKSECMSSTVPKTVNLNRTENQNTVFNLSSTNIFNKYKNAGYGNMDTVSTKGKSTMLNCNNNNNNNEKSSNFNYSASAFNCINGCKSTKKLCSKTESKIMNTIAISTKISNLPISKQKSTKCNSELDDDDLFCSLDFRIVDTLQHSFRNPSDQSSVPKFDKSNTVSDPVKMIPATTHPLPKYLKEQIERRRLEAKKKLFSKKHKSM